MKKCCVIIPIYNTIPTQSEILSIERSLAILSEYDIFMIHSATMNLRNYYCYDSIQFISFSPRYFKSNKSYSRLLLSKKFYIPFLNYEYLLIAQTDTYILNTNYSLESFAIKGYDYWGAPWPNGPFSKPYNLKDYIKLLFIPHPENCHIGNGGFSLRKVTSTYHLTKKYCLIIKTLWHFNEDLFFSWCAQGSKNNYNTASIVEASSFALETNARSEIEKGNIPYAVHAWEKIFTIEEIKELSIL